MSNLLIHSMSEFSDIILETLHVAQARTITEVGAEFGGMSQQLAAYAQVKGGMLTSIDPAPKPEFVAWAAHCKTITHVPAASLDAMPNVGPTDAWVIDGDHNYYTVYNELRLADENSRRHGKPLLSIMHDVSWPCARRDFYYAPDRIPAYARHPYSYDGGVTIGNPDLMPGRGFRGHGSFAWATKEGGPKNGVLTAIEDFLAEKRAEGRDLAWAHVPAVFGLGVIFDTNAPWAQDVANILIPYHDNKLIGSLELNRLRNYLAVIDWQDRQAELERRAAA